MSDLVSKFFVRCIWQKISCKIRCRKDSERTQCQISGKNCGLQILELDGAYQICTKPSQSEYLIRIAKQPRKQVLTDVLLETLSIVAYKQPVTKAEIEQIRGVSCSHAINKLLEYGLITEAGRLNAPGRPILLATTEEFLRTFGVQSVEGLPSVSPEEMETLKTEAEEEVQMTLDV